MTKKQKLQLFGLCFSILVIALIIRNKSNNINIETNPVNNKTKLINCSSVDLKNLIPAIDFSGRINSSQKINIISEVNGVSKVVGSRFEIGEKFKRGEVLLSVKDNDISLELKSIKSQFLALLVQVLPDIKMDFPKLGNTMQQYINNFTVNGKIEDFPKTLGAKERTFLSSRQVFANYYSIKALENKLDKFKIQAPFDGVLTKTLVDPGSNVIVGQPLGEFINPNKYEIMTSVSIKESSLIKLNNKVKIISDDIQSEIIGKVSRVGNHINEFTQSIDVFISIEEGDVIDGMYVSGQIICDEIPDVYKIERTRILENNAVYVLNEGVLRTKPVHILAFQNDSVIIQGVNENDCIVNEYRHYFYDGMTAN